MNPGKRQTRPGEDAAFLNALSGMVCDRLDEFLEHLGVELRPSGKRMVGRCPVHGGSNPVSLNLYPDGFEARGNWRCNSRKCHTHFVSSIIGLTRGVLSHERHGWEGPGGRRVSHQETVDYLLDFLGVALGEVRVNTDAEKLSRFARGVEAMTLRLPTERSALCTREQLHRQIEIPAEYYLARGFKESTLRDYEVGVVRSPRSEHYRRILYPVYDAKGEKIIGGVSRSPDPKCGECKLCHPEGSPCPTDEHRLKYVRWRLVGDFKDKHHLYNYWRSADAIRQTKTVVVVEGAGDVWRLAEAGVTNAVGLFGSDLSDLQVNTLLGCGARNIVVLTDADEAGESAWRQVNETCLFANKRRVLPVGVAEVGDMSAEDVKKHIIPKL